MQLQENHAAGILQNISKTHTADQMDKNNSATPPTTLLANSLASNGFSHEFRQVKIILLGNLT